MILDNLLRIASDRYEQSPEDIIEDPRTNATFLGVTPDNLVNYYRDIHNAGKIDRSASFLESLEAYKKQQADKKIEEMIDGTITSPADEAFITN
jgi:hypothetical protein